MAARKKRKAVRNVSISKSECSCCSTNDAHLKEWLLIILGAIGVINVVYPSMLDFPGFAQLFQIAWPVLVLVIGITSVMEKKCC
ncbi:MAG: hypothetical protein NT051_02150 [Candidatus Micrarchaeota archaeon]|nr:hypothetical protein [Candidatus Micrarchaeota archaeon]